MRTRCATFSRTPRVTVNRANDLKIRPEDRVPARSLVNSHHLFDHWMEVAAKIRSARRITLFLDFDGTLTPLRRRPEDVEPLRAELRRLLARLSRHRKLVLYIISGRALGDLRKLVPLGGIRLLGLHGWEGRRTQALSRERRLLRRARQMLRQGLGERSQVWVENKGLGVAIHYREASPKAVRLARPLVRDVARSFSPHLRLMNGKKVWELLPSAILGKGPAVEALLDGSAKTTLAVFVGDDTTDEAAFEALPKGLTIHVGKNRRTKACYRLRNPQEVRQFLERLEGELT